MAKTVMAVASCVLAVFAASSGAMARQYSETDIPFIIKYSETHNSDQAFDYFSDAEFSGSGRFGKIDSTTLVDKEITMISVITDYGQVSCIVANGTTVGISAGSKIRIRSTTPGIFPLKDMIMLGHDCIVERAIAAAPPQQQYATLPPPMPGLGPTTLSPKTPTAYPKFYAYEGAPAESSGRGAAFDQGYADRTQYQGWRNSLLAGPFREGALYWEGRRSIPGAACSRDFTGEFYAGCVADQRMIAPYDRRRLADPEYRAGWNAVPAGG